MSFPLNNNTNTVRKTQHNYTKPDILSARQNNSREQELQQKLKQTSLTSNPTSVKNVNNDGFPDIPPTELAARKKKFASFKFFLDNLDPTVSKRIERGIRLMGAVSISFVCVYLKITKKKKTL